MIYVYLYACLCVCVCQEYLAGGLDVLVQADERYKPRSQQTQQQLPPYHPQIVDAVCQLQHVIAVNKVFAPPTTSLDSVTS